MFTELFNKFLAFIRGLQNNTPLVQSTGTRREVIRGRYQELMDELKDATSLNSLVVIRKRIQVFKQLTIDNHEEIWARPFVMALTQVWNLKYRAWKKRR